MTLPEQPIDRAELAIWAGRRRATAAAHFADAWRQQVRGPELYRVAVVFAAWTDVLGIVESDDVEEALYALRACRGTAQGLLVLAADDDVSAGVEIEVYSEACETVAAALALMAGGS